MVLSWIRTVFLALALLVGILYGIHLYQVEHKIAPLLISSGVSILIGFTFIYLTNFAKKTSLRSLNIVTLGLFFGYLLAQAVLLMVNAVAEFAPIISADIGELVRIGIFLFCSYIGVLFTWNATEEWAVSIPFVRLVPEQNKKKDLLLDSSILMDTRLIDLASSGLLDCHLILPRFILAEIQRLSEFDDEGTRHKAKRAIEVVNKLEGLSSLNLRIVDHDFSEVKDFLQKLVHLARLLDTHILTADPSRVQQGSYEGVRFINIHALSNALKPIIQGGELLPIKIQRYGKEPGQGVGYLDDGTMVVVNGGADFLGDTIKVSVLSVKHTSAGRMIFCNTQEEEQVKMREGLSTHEEAAKSYFAL